MENVIRASVSGEEVLAYRDRSGVGIVEARMRLEGTAIMHALKTIRQNSQDPNIVMLSDIMEVLLGRGSA